MTIVKKVAEKKVVAEKKKVEKKVAEKKKVAAKKEVKKEVVKKVVPKKEHKEDTTDVAIEENAELEVKMTKKEKEVHAE